MIMGILHAYVKPHSPLAATSWSINGYCKAHRNFRKIFPEISPSAKTLSLREDFPRRGSGFQQVGRTARVLSGPFHGLALEAQQECGPGSHLTYISNKHVEHLTAHEKN